jgi:hypothetical protein
MSATARALPDAPAEAVIVGAEIVAGHDGAAEMIVSLRHGNGVVSPVTLDAEVGFALMKHCGVASLAGLAGHSWRKIVEGL